MDVCTDVRVNVCTDVRVRICMNVRVNICTDVRVDVGLPVPEMWHCACVPIRMIVRLVRVRSVCCQKPIKARIPIPLNVLFL